MNVDLILAMIKRREQRAKDRAASLERDPMLKSAATSERNVQGAMAALRIDIENAIKIEDRDS
jgi:hypothetical protein